MFTKVNPDFSYLLAGGVVGLILVILFFACTRGKKPELQDRAILMKEVNQASEQFNNTPENPKIRLNLAKKLFESGDFSQARRHLESFLNQKQPPVEALWLMAHLEYLDGQYNRAEALLHKILSQTKGNSELRAKAELGLVFVYYQTLEYAKSKNLFKGLEGKIQLPIWELMKSFGSRKPYQIEWKNQTKVEIPFLFTDPLPVIELEIQGKSIYAIIDTGGDMFYLDDEVAKTMGIQPVTRQLEPGFAGGKSSEIGYARADSLRLGSIALSSVPIKLGSISRFSEMLTNHQFPISGVLGTGELRQFLATMDYLNGRLILRPRSETGKQTLQAELQSKTVTNIPFVLAMTHLIIAQGSINGKNNLKFFLDSGLADSEAGILLPEQTLNYIGIPLPTLEKLPENMGGLGGGGFSVGRFTVETLQIGPLVQKNLPGMFGVFPPQLYREAEFLIDGIVSHRFLRNYSWTIDFEARNMIFSK